MKIFIKCLEEFKGYFKIDFILIVEIDNWNEDFCGKVVF